MFVSMCYVMIQERMPQIPGRKGDVEGNSRVIPGAFLQKGHVDRAVFPGQPL